jgi:hypothetical protein
MHAIIMEDEKSRLHLGWGFAFGMSLLPVGHLLLLQWANDLVWQAISSLVRSALGVLLPCRIGPSAHPVPSPTATHFAVTTCL